MRKIRNIEADNVIIGDNIKGLHKYFYEPLKLKYDKDLPDWKIGNELHISQSQISRRRDKAIKKVAEWEAWQHMQK